MARKVSRVATPEERERHAIVREQIKSELPDIKIRAKQMLDRSAFAKSIKKAHIAVVVLE